MFVCATPARMCSLSDVSAQTCVKGDDELSDALS